MRVWWTALAMVSLVACGVRPGLSDTEAGEIGRVVRVIDGDALALSTGQNVRLVGIEAPVLRTRSREPDVYAAESARLLDDLALGREVQLHYPGLTRDRYDRALAHVLTNDDAGPEVWLNLKMVKQGAARVRLYPDTAVHAKTLLEAEKQARDERRGLWERSAYRVRDAAELSTDFRGFTIVTATLGAELVGDAVGPADSCKRRLVGARLVVVARNDANTFCDLSLGTPVRLRGWVSDQSLDLTVPWHAEILDDVEPITG